MPKIEFPNGATHARQKQDGVSIIVARGTPELLDPEGKKIEYGYYRGGKFAPYVEGAEPVTLRPAASVANAEGVGKTEFIARLIIEEKYTAREIAAKVVFAYPGTPFDKALSLTRAVPWHLKQKGINKTYLKEGSNRERRVVRVLNALADSQ